MNNQDHIQEAVNAPVVTFSNIPLDDEPVVQEPGAVPAVPDVTIVGVQFKKGGKVYYFDPGPLNIETGEEVIIDTARGPEYGFCAQGNHAVPADKVIQPLRSVIRIASDTDRATRLSYQDKEPQALEICQKKIAEHGLDMKLVSAEYSFDGSKILFYFTADGRVDFRELVRDLASEFRTRIELRQIGVRDEAKLMGGLGICGRPFCCKQFLDDFQPVSIKMAKTQSLSLNPTKISGCCGRLMCCLKYEQDAYESLQKTTPKTESIVNTYDGKGTVTEASLLKQTVKVRLDSDTSTLKTYKVDEIQVLRNGKGRKTDPPIPDDIPPLPKPEPKQQEPEVMSEFDQALSFLSSYAADEEPKAPEAPQEQAQPRPKHQSRGNRGSRHRSGRRGGAASQTKEPKEAQKAPQKAPQASAGEGQKPQGEGNKKRSHRRRYYGKRSGNSSSQQS